MRTPLLSCLLGLPLAVTAHVGPPPTGTQPYKEALHGLEISDPYRLRPLRARQPPLAKGPGATTFGPSPT